MLVQLAASPRLFAFVVLKIDTQPAVGCYHVQQQNASSEAMTELSGNLMITLVIAFKAPNMSEISHQARNHRVVGRAPWPVCASNTVNQNPATE